MKLFDWLGTLKSRNEDITSDALRIAALEAANKALKADNQKLGEALATMKLRNLVLEIKHGKLLKSKEYTTGVKRLAAIAKYRRGRA